MTLQVTNPRTVETEMTEAERREEAESAWWRSTFATVFGAFVVTLVGLYIFSRISPDYSGPWLTVALVGLPVIGGVVERLTR